MLLLLFDFRAPKKEEAKLAPPPPPSPAAPKAVAAVDDSLLKKKQERDNQAAASRTLADLKAALDEVSIAAVAAHNQAAQHIRGGCTAFTLLVIDPLSLYILI